MSSDLVLDISRDDTRLKISVYEKSQQGERTLRQYEDVKAAWDEIESARNEIINLLNRANKRAKVSPEIFENLKKTGQILFDLLLPPKAREKLNSTAASNLILYVDDKLVHIPWELLFNGHEFICRRFAMGRIVSTRQTPTSVSRRTLKLPFGVLVLADPRGDLKASYDEGIEIRNFLDNRKDSFHVNFKSHPVDVPYVKKNLRDYDIVHYAGHAGYHSENPSESGWLLTDGRLKASDISAMGGLQPMPSLVFSNACQTGQTDEWKIQEGYEQQIFGLANAYLLSGVQHYIGTFWEILDEPSSQFAKLFYGFLTQGESIGESVRKARAELIKAFGEETIVWASYMLYGDPTFQFTPVEAKQIEEPIIPAKTAPEWAHVMRGDSAVTSAPARRRVSHWRYPLLAAVLLTLGIAGYYGFQLASQKTEIETTPASATLVAPPSDLETKGKEIASEQSKVDDNPEPVKSKSSNILVTEKVSLPHPASAASPKGLAQDSVPVPPVIEELASINETAPPVVAAPLTLSMNIIGQRKEPDGGYTEVLVSEGGVMRSYDNFQVHLEVSRPTYVYILIYDSQGKAEQLFPDAKIDHPEFIESARKVVIPRRDLWFWLDEHPGTETIYVLASEKPMPDIQGLLAKMEGGDDSGKQRVSREIKQRIAIMQRGVGGITKGSAVTYTLSDGKKIQKVTDVVTGTGSVVRAVSFLHR
jgi:CHAT domain-containing protein